jgi:hypothetical protein
MDYYFTILEVALVLTIYLFPKEVESALAIYFFPKPQTLFLAMDSFCDTVWVGEGGRSECLHLLMKYQDFEYSVRQRENLEMENLVFNLYFLVHMTVFAVVPAAVLVSQRLNDWFTATVVPFILNRRYHRAPVNIPYQYEYNLEIRDYQPGDFRKPVVAGTAPTAAAAAVAPDASTSETSFTYPEREYEHTYVSDLTPDGLVFMRFSPKEDAFVYYSSRTVIYNYLNALARKYVIQTNNPGVYIYGEKWFDELNVAQDVSNETDTKNAPESDGNGNDDSESESDDEEDEANSVFIKAKPIMGASRAMDTNNKAPGKNDKEDAPVPANKFIRLGTVADMKLGQHQRLEKKIRPMTFADFKTMFFGAKE